MAPTLRHHVPMALDFERLARAVATAREARKWRQEDLATAAGISLSSVQNIEGARSFTRVPPSLRKIDKALGWELGSCLDILRGGDPTLVSGSVDRRANSGDVQPDGLRGLPAGIRAALSEGEHLAGDVIDLSEPDSDFRLIVVAQRGMYRTEEDIETLRKQMKRWMEIQEGIRGLVRDRENTQAKEDN